MHSDTLPPVEAGPTTAPVDRLIEACRCILAPLVEADGGELFVVSVTPAEIVLHLSGHCAGCPGSSSTHEFVIEPTLRAIASDLKVRVTTGYIVPPGALRVEAPRRPAAVGDGNGSSSR